MITKKLLSFSTATLPSPAEMWAQIQALSQALAAAQTRLAQLEKQAVQEATHDDVINAAVKVQGYCTRHDFRPAIALTEGSGVDVSNLGTIKFQIDLQEIGYPRSAVAGHTKRFVTGLELEDGTHLLVIPRFHAYERDLTQFHSEDNALAKNIFGPRMCSLLGIKTLVLSTASGVMYPSSQYGSDNLPVKLGDIVPIEKFVPLVQTFGGGRLDPSGVLNGFVKRAKARHEPTLQTPAKDRKYFDCFGAPAPDLIGQALQTLSELGVSNPFAWPHIQTAGPQYEQATIKEALSGLFGQFKALLVSMSTQAEAFAAIWLGIRVIAFSLVSNVEFGTAPTPMPNHDDVQRQIAEIKERFNQFLRVFIPKINQT